MFKCAEALYVELPMKIRETDTFCLLTFSLCSDNTSINSSRESWLSFVPHYVSTLPSWQHPIKNSVIIRLFISQTQMFKMRVCHTWTLYLRRKWAGCFLRWVKIFSSIFHSDILFSFIHFYWRCNRPRHLDFAPHDKCFLYFPMKANYFAVWWTPVFFSLCSAAAIKARCRCRYPSVTSGFFLTWFGQVFKIYTLFFSQLLRVVLFL